MLLSHWLSHFFWARVEKPSRVSSCIADTQTLSHRSTFTHRLGFIYPEKMIGQKSIKLFFSPTCKKRELDKLSRSEDVCDVSKYTSVVMVTDELVTCY